MLTSFPKSSAGWKRSVRFCKAMLLTFSAPSRTSCMTPNILDLPTAQQKGLLRLCNRHKEVPKYLLHQMNLRRIQTAVHKFHEAWAFGFRVILCLYLHSRIILRVVRSEGIVQHIVQTVCAVDNVRVWIDFVYRLPYF